MFFKRKIPKQSQDNSSWEEHKYQTFSDRWANSYTTSSYSDYNNFIVDPQYYYQFLTEEEAKAEREKDELRSQAIEKRNKVLIKKLIKAKKKLTKIQLEVGKDYFLKGNSYADIAKDRNCSESAVRQVLLGNSKGQGGLIQKLKKILGKPKNYFDFD